MAETPEEVAMELCPVGFRPHTPDGRGNRCSCVALAAALRAQYVAGLEAAANLAALVPTQQRLEVAEAIRELAEQAKMEGT